MAIHSTVTVFSILVLTVLSSLHFSSAAVTKLWVVYNEKAQTFQIVNSSVSDFVAVASFDNTINATGWAKLDVSTQAGENGKYSDSQQIYAAGFVEGHITRSLMSMHWTNTLAGFCSEPVSWQCKQLQAYLENNFKWMQQQITDNVPGGSPYWYHVQLYLLQMAGLQDGYSNYPGVLNTNIDVMGVYLWQVGGDLEDLNQLFPSEKKPLNRKDPLFTGTGHCSALIRLLPDFSDLYVAQDTWNDLPSMLRILKRYNFELHLAEGLDNLIAGNTMTFSSYPGSLSSGDDFYAISSGLVTQETTIGNSNSDLLVYIKYTSVFEGIRTMVANRLAASGREWAQIVSQYNSGTYNNQWMVIDYHRFRPYSKKPVPGLFYLLEQIPGTIEYQDLTQLLYNNLYFGSYNIAYFPDIFNKSGGPEAVAQYGDWFTYDKNPRARIFQRDVGKVRDLTSMTKLMRYNNFQKDPLSRCNCTPPYSAENAIACRDDLNPINGTYAFGSLGHRPHIATDMKLTNIQLFRSLSFLAISSPTYDDLPPFQWSTSDYNYLSHVGHPDLWKFPVITFNGTNPMA
ncbi:unnamed protein product [Candidula unifasciata]|uniref:Phospholipase B-like n=1 Tax=Candidula unifasciata TaxID=100452 RepID=A0A8S3Z7F9_9EUPU|nr:unnamed protein product [Candidula unifasciata]